MICENCHGDAILRCSACKETWYCSSACQTEAWSHHKRGCKIQQELNKINAIHAAREPVKPRTDRCTGCSLSWDEDEGTVADDVCETCEYQACESCVSHQSRGTCYCPNSNFGRPYCCMEPRWWHANGRGKSYQGDRHPESYGEPFPDDMYEPEPRKCNNCGEVARLFKKEYC